jgi:hypothetical protein
VKRLGFHATAKIRSLSRNKTARCAGFENFRPGQRLGLLDVAVVSSLSARFLLLPTEEKGLSTPPTQRKTTTKKLMSALYT